jgi:hypothetical protein
MTYSVSNPPAMVAQRIGDGPAFWAYKSADAVGDVDGTDYFTNGAALGMRVGDLVWVYDTNTPLCTMCWVSTVDADGNATVTQHA